MNCRYTFFFHDMGSYTTKAESWSKALWQINSARERGGLKKISLSTARRGLTCKTTLAPPSPFTKIKVNA